MTTGRVLHPLGASRFARLDGDRGLHYRVSGTGSPTVVFESGIGQPGAAWGLVQPSVAAHTRTIVYDRAGLGASDPDPHERTLDRLAADLSALLEQLPGPIILVGHSWGGPIVRTVAASGSFDVTGMVLIDPADERDPEFFAPSARRLAVFARVVLRGLGATGAYRLAARSARGMPKPAFVEYRDAFGPRGTAALAREMRHMLPGMTAMRALPPDAGTIPMTIISAPDRRKSTTLSRAHRASAQAVSGKYVEAPGCGHYVHLDRPQLVIDEILEVLSRSTTPTRSADTGDCRDVSEPCD